MSARSRVAGLATIAVLAAGCEGDRAPVVGSPEPEATPVSSSADAVTPSDPSETPGGEPVKIDDGRHFVYAKKVLISGKETVLMFDLAYLLTGEDAAEAAREHGDEYPPPNDYYIVNDNPRVRKVPFSGDVEVLYIPTGTCCDLFRGDPAAWIEAVNSASQTDYAGGDTPWWIVVEMGEVVRIEQQYLP